jgi:hypothetical protein
VDKRSSLTLARWLPDSHNEEGIASLDRSLIKGKRPEYIATVNAKDAESAIAVVIKDHEITDRERMQRLAARPA